MRPLLCATVAAPTMALLRERRDGCQTADLVELRLDLVRDPDVTAALAGRQRPVIVTCRPVWEGGGFSGSEEERHRILAAALAAGADYIDIEWRAGFLDLIRMRQGKRVILSMHDYAGVPRDLLDRFQAMRATGAEVVKLAVMSRRLTDSLPLLEIGRRAEGSSVLVAMGAAGVPSRVLAAHFGSRWSYAGDDVAPGQMTVDRMLGEFRFNRISPATAVYGVVGAPVGHSISPAMHNAAFAAVGLDAVYVPFEADGANDFLAFAETMGVRGASVTAPFKQAVFELVDEIDDVSRRVGAVNTVRRDGGRWSAMNTDVAGFLAPLDGQVDLAGTRAAVIGAGGAARAVAIALASRGAHVKIYARSRERAMPVAVLAGGTAHALPPPPGSWDVLVNATPVGTHPRVGESPVEDSSLEGRLVYDLIYNPPRTKLLADAEAAGCATIDGLQMLVAQAELQFEWWTGRQSPPGLMRGAALDRLRRLDPDVPALNPA